ncbi:hypothetical protein FIBSPDRAFT_939269 [Athelia psychrophila]|uniref:Uncharacterized protein n=1 Tax=Athelia psychrophila TaxID=1759441 RepID=A0A165WTI0_9AGAM|nr:hypothetical protein FIBSPDRAFT_939269 [Fibularhizoctonia sp. CBS 109695]
MTNEDTAPTCVLAHPQPRAGAARFDVQPNPTWTLDSLEVHDYARVLSSTLAIFEINIDARPIQYAGSGQPRKAIVAGPPPRDGGVEKDDAGECRACQTKKIRPDLLREGRGGVGGERRSVPASQSIMLVVLASTPAYTVGMVRDGRAPMRRASIRVMRARMRQYFIAGWYGEIGMYIDDIQVYSQDEQSRTFKTLVSLSLSRSHTTKTPSEKDYQDEEIDLRTKKWQEANITISSRRIPAQGRTRKGRWMGIEAWRRMPHKCLMNIGLRRTRSKGRGRQRILRLIGRTLGSIAIICVSPLYQLRSHLRHPYRSTPRVRHFPLFITAPHLHRCMTFIPSSYYCHCDTVNLDRSA